MLRDVERFRDGDRGRDAFAKAYRRTHPRAVEILQQDWERMVAFYDFAKEHWKHLRTTNVVESPFAAMRLRTDAAKRFMKTETNPSRTADRANVVRIDMTASGASIVAIGALN